MYTLRPYQQEGSDRIFERSKQYLAYQPGLGKTLTFLDAVTRADMRRNLILAPKNALYVWQYELQERFNIDGIVYTGKPHERAKIWLQYQKQPNMFFITNYALAEEVVQLWQQNNLEWDGIACDEIHLSGLMNQKAQTFKRLRKMLQSSQMLVPLTGTPVRRNLADLYAPLHLIAPKRFKSYWYFVQDYCNTYNDGYGMKIMKRPKDPQAIIDIRKEFIIYKTKKEAEPDLPPKLRQVWPLEMTLTQKKLYHQLDKELLMELPKTGELVITPNMATKIVRQRQLLVTPMLFGVDDPGSALMSLLEIADDEFECQRPIAIFTPFREAIPIIDNLLRQKLNANEIYIIRGGMTAEEVGIAWKSFQNSENPRRAIISTIKSSASWNGHTAHKGIFLGCEWSGLDNTQAEDRIHRLGLDHAVHLIYLLYHGTNDDAIIECLDGKQGASDWILHTEMMLARLRHKKS
jgi:SNF2 family DNA or RNA helicase